MASDNEGTCVNDPNFAVICSFLSKFARLCGITHPNFVDLQHMIENTQEVPQPLVDLHVKLLRKARKSVSGEKWERAVIKFCHTYSNQDGWEIERFGYKKARIPVKLNILKALLELQFDMNNKFKSEINKWSANDLRCQPIGRDKLGQNYWYHLDEDCNLRVYREDLDDETWEVVAENREGLVHLLSQLSSNDPFKKESDPSLNEDSNSLEIEKPITDTGQIEDLKVEEFSTESNKNEEESENCVIKIKLENNIKNNLKTKEENIKIKINIKKDDVKNEIFDTSNYPSIKSENEPSNKDTNNSNLSKNSQENNDTPIQNDRIITENKISLQKSFAKNNEHEKDESSNEKNIQKFSNQKKSENEISSENEANDLSKATEKKPVSDNSSQNDSKQESTKILKDNDVNEEPVKLKNANEEPVKSKNVNEELVKFKTVIEELVKSKNVIEESVKSKNVNEELVKSKNDSKELVKSKNDSKELVKSKNDTKELVKSKNDSKELVKSKNVNEELIKSKIINEELVESKKVNEELVESKKVDKKLVESKKVDKELVESKKVDKELVESKKVDKELVESKKVDEELQESKIIDEELKESKRVDEELVESKRADELVESKKVDQEMDSKTIDEELMESNNVNEELMESKNVNEELVTKTKIESPQVSTVAKDLVNDKLKNIIKLDKKRLSEGDYVSSDSKRKCLEEDGDNINEVGEAIEEPLMLIQGEGNGKECDTGNPEKTDKEGQSTELNKNMDKEKKEVKKSNIPPETSVNPEANLEEPIKNNSENNKPENNSNNENLEGKFISIKKNKTEKESIPPIFSAGSSTSENFETNGIKQILNNSDQSKNKPDHIISCPDNKSKKNLNTQVNKKLSISFKSSHSMESEKINPQLIEGECSETNQKPSNESKITHSDVIFPHKDKRIDEISSNNNIEGNQQKLNPSGASEIFNKMQLKNYPDISFATLTTPKEGKSKEEFIKSNIEDKSQIFFRPNCLKLPDSLIVKPISINKELQIENSKNPLDSEIIVHKLNPDDKRPKEGTLKIKKPEDLNKTFELSLKEELSKKASMAKDKTKSKPTSSFHPKIPSPLIDSSITLSLTKQDDIREKEKIHNYNRLEKTLLPYSSKQSIDLEDNLNLITTSSLSKEISICPKDKHPCNEIFLSVNALNRKKENFLKSSITKHNQEYTKSLKSEETPKFQRKLSAKPEEIQGLSSTTKEFPLTNEVKIEIIKNKKNESFDSLNKSLPSTSGEKLNIGKSSNNNFSKFETKLTEGSLSNETNYNKKDNSYIKIEDDKKLTILKNKNVKSEDDNNSRNDNLSKEINDTKLNFKQKTIFPIIERKISSSETLIFEAREEKIENTRSKDKSLEISQIKFLKDLKDSDVSTETNIYKNTKKNDKTKSGKDISFLNVNTQKKEFDKTKEKQLKQIKDICQIRNLKEIEIIEKDTISSKNANTNKKLTYDGVKQVDSKIDNKSMRGQLKVTEESIKLNENTKIKDPLEKRISNSCENLKVDQHKDIKINEDSNQKVISNKESKDKIKGIEQTFNKHEKKKEITSIRTDDDQKSSQASLTNTNSNNISTKTSNIKKSNSLILLKNDSSRPKNISEKKTCLDQEKLPLKANVMDEKGQSEVLEKFDIAIESEDFKKKNKFEKEEIKTPELTRKVLRRTANRIAESKAKKDIEETPPSRFVSRKRSNPRVPQSFDSDDDIEEVTSQAQDDDCAGGKRPRLRVKKTPDIELRRSVEKNKLLLQKQGTSSEDNEETSPLRQRRVKNSQQSESKKRGRGRPTGRGRVNDKSIDLKTPLLSSDMTPDNEINSENRTKKSQSRKKTKKILGLDVEEESLLDEAQTDEISESKTTPVRQSRRIAQIKIKEEAERRKLEEFTLYQLKEDQKKRNDKDVKDSKGGKRKKRTQPSDDDDDEADEDYEEEKTKKKKKKRKKKGNKFNENKPWASSSESSESQEEEEDHEPTEDEEEDNLVFKSDHEFSPESDLEKEEDAEPTRRARTAQKESDTEEQADDHACQKCNKSDHPEWILLCDKCDSGWHCSCLRPALFVIPEGDWFCPPCEHSFLLEKLEENLRVFDSNLKKRENEELRKKRLAYVGISLDNVLPNKDRENKENADEDEEIHPNKNDSYSSSSESETESSSGSSDSEPVYQLRERRTALFSYRFNEYDDLINSAIQDEMEAVKGAGNQGRGKDISNIVEANEKEEQTSIEKDESELKDTEIQDDSEKVPKSINENLNLIESPKEKEKNDDQSGHSSEANEDEEDVITPMRKLIGRKKHRRLNNLDISSEDDADSDEDFHGTSSNDAESDEDFDDDPDDSSSDNGRRRKKKKGSKVPVRRSARTRTTRFDKEFINDDSDDSEGPRKKKTRRLRIDSDSEESDSTWGRRKTKKSYSSFSKPKSKKKKKSYYEDSDSGLFKVKKSKKPKVSYGLLNEEDNIRKTRGCKINYQEIIGTDSEDEIPKKKQDSEDEYVAEEDEEEIAHDEVDEVDEIDEAEKDSESSEENIESNENQKSKDNSSDNESTKNKNEKTTKENSEDEESEDDLEGMENLDDELAQDQEFGEFIKNEEKDVAMVLNDAEITKTPSKEKENTGKDKKITESKNVKKEKSETKNVANSKENDKGNQIQEDSHPVPKCPSENQKSNERESSPDKDSDSETPKFTSQQSSDNDNNFNTQPSVITRILTQPTYIEQPSNFSQTSSNISNKYLTPSSTEPTPISSSNPSSSISYPISPRGKISSSYRPPSSSSPNVNMPQFSSSRSVRTSAITAIRSRTTGNQNLSPQIYHNPHPLDPSPSGGGPISISSNRSERSENTSSTINSPSIAVSNVSNTLPGKTGQSSTTSSTPPPHFMRSPHGRFSSNDGSTPSAIQQIRPSNFSATTSSQSSNSQHSERGTVSDNFLPYQSPSNYQFNTFPTGQNIPSGDNNLSQSTYQGSPYQEQFPSESSPNPATADSEKPYEGGEGGEFGGLVSYFSSQREEEDLDT